MPRRNVLSANQEALLDALLAIVKLQAASHQINYTALTSKHDLEKLLGGNHDISLLHGWRRGIAGQHVLNFLQGQSQLTVTDQDIVIIPTIT